MSLYCGACRSGFARLVELGLPGQLGPRAGFADCDGCGEWAEVYTCAVATAGEDAGE